MAASAMGQAADSFWLDMMAGLDFAIRDGICDREELDRVPFRRSPCEMGY